ncbi:MAG: glycogen debranching protein GlgX [Spirochaetaceae bacterium]|nr:glycogen debranching protein GlgX [Spirochaetaceae bacterium]
MNKLSVQLGKPFPLGATLEHDGVNFSVFTRNGTKVFLDVFNGKEDAEPYFTYEFDPEMNRTGDIWYVKIMGLKANSLYLYRVDGPFNPEQGHRFNKKQYLLDPYAKALTDDSIFENLSDNYIIPVDSMDIEFSKQRTAAGFPKCVVIDNNFDWQGDRPLNYPLKSCIIYEAHLRGLTQSPSSGVAHPGTYKGLIEKIPYFKELGITSIELLPIQEFDAYENTNVNPKNGQRLKNYWGYSTIAFFAPKATYAFDRTPGGQVNEFKEMVRELHKAGIEVILDIVFNHTAEGNEHGVMINFRGFDNSIYYILEDDKKQYYKNFSGCGNTVNCNHPVVHEFIIDCLKYWVIDMHVDGFRFDLGSILGRDRNGNLMKNPPVLERIAEEPILRNTKIIAEAWDAGGAYQVGCFPGGRWAEWNDRFRDDIRRFWRGDDNTVTSAATRLCGSSDLYSNDGRKPFHSINFITSHDGFTMNDLVSYNGKHNDENGENNHDGSDNNSSYNYGFEGPTSNQKIETTRMRQIKNLMLTLLFSQGTPMFVAGDEFRRTQNGNNNAYCQDNEISWIDWTLKDKYKDLYTFVRKAIIFRKQHPALRRPEFFTGCDISKNSLSDIDWYDETGKAPDWSKQNLFLAYRLDGSRDEIYAEHDDNDFFIMLNAAQKDYTVMLPKARAEKEWYRCVDTSVASPNDFLMKDEEEYLKDQSVYVLPARSFAILLSK